MQALYTRRIMGFILVGIFAIIFIGFILHTIRLQNTINRLSAVHARR